MSKPKKNKRPVSGIFLLDKRQGVTSNKALQEVRHSFCAEKAGHTGALDPMATGLLPICLGEATKFSHFLLDSDKGYRTTIQLGQKTDTADAEGKVIATKPLPKLSERLLNEVLASFLGNQLQTPPMYSALKKDGKKLYELAREGIEIARTARPIFIKNITLESFTENSITLSVMCSKGTYIRVLGEDIAEKLDTLGHLTMLRRTQTGHFKLENAHTFVELEAIQTISEKDALLLPSYASIKHFPKVQLDEAQKKRILVGQRLNVFEQVKSLFTTLPNTAEQAPKKEVLIFCQEQFLGLGMVEASGRLQPKRLVNN